MTGIIVVGVDGSQTAQHAANAARDLAIALGTRLHVLTAYTTDQTESLSSGSDSWLLTNAGAAERLARKVADRLRTGDLVIEHFAARETPATALIKHAETHGASMIVVGNRRMQGIGRLLGSVANHVAHHAPCDVYVAKTDEPN
ncbi:MULTISPECIES: universal stress protein [unclassified Arthrobacter]|uniref:universal stress protein n=1 Tax=unclassified Arthrobacter TaxID=235627 RepID=UPI001C855613|nr:universal stress protein [Arthrobacter sp. MAHUQ-56]MBX7445953.1 universal stress protein [Arthrobacter sp. MAHUQ-56]